MKKKDKKMLSLNSGTVVNLIYNYSLPQKKGSEREGGTVTPGTPPPFRSGPAKQCKIHRDLFLQRQQPSGNDTAYYLFTDVQARFFS